MNLRACTPFILAAVAMVAVFGIPTLLLSPVDHEMHCPFSAGQVAACSTGILEHVTHWQSAFASTLVGLFAFVALALFVVRHLSFALEPEPGSTRIRIRLRALRPTLLQELFAQGILNPKPF